MVVLVLGYALPYSVISGHYANSLMVSSLAPPDFGRSVNSISTKGVILCTYCTPNNTNTPWIFRPSYGPEKLSRISIFDPEPLLKWLKLLLEK